MTNSSAIVAACRCKLALVLAVLTVFSGNAALALDKVALGKAVPNSFAFGATEVGIEAVMTITSQVVAERLNQLM